MLSEFCGYAANPYGRSLREEPVDVFINSGYKHSFDKITIVELQGIAPTS